MSWRDFQFESPLDFMDKMDKSPRLIEQISIQNDFCPLNPFCPEEIENRNNPLQEEIQPFQKSPNFTFSAQEQFTRESSWTHASNPELTARTVAPPCTHPVNRVVRQQPETMAQTVASWPRDSRLEYAGLVGRLRRDGVAMEGALSAAFQAMTQTKEEEVV